MHTHPYDTITLDNGAKLVLTPCPGSKGVGLAASITILKEAGANMLLTLMFDDDMVNNNITALPMLCEENNMAWLQLPIVDDGVPCEVFDLQWHEYIDAILKVIHNKGTITIHCKGGYGRTGLVAGLILLCHGLTADQAMKKVQNVRPDSLKNEQQLTYFNSFICPIVTS